MVLPFPPKGDSRVALERVDSPPRGPPPPGAGEDGVDDDGREGEDDAPDDRAAERERSPDGHDLQDPPHRRVVRARRGGERLDGSLEPARERVSAAGRRRRRDDADADARGRERGVVERGGRAATSSRVW